jgi:hypothetical protein
MTDLEILRRDLACARMPRPARRVMAVALAIGVATTAVALAANHYLGQPAPAHVRATFARLAAWQPNVDPIDAAHAQVVALSPHTVLFGAPTRSGSYCLELIGKGGFEYEVFCAGPHDPKRLALYAGFANHGTASHLPPMAVTGRISERARTLEARTPDGHVEQVKLGLHGFFSFEPVEQAAARRGDLTLLERDAAGSVTTRIHVPPQVVLDTQGSPVRQIEGVITDPRAKHIFFEVWAEQPLGLGERCIHCPAHAVGFAQTGVGKTVDIHPNGRFSFTAPKLAYKRWWLSMLVVDARLVPLDQGVVDGTPIPDAHFWHLAQREAARS